MISFLSIDTIAFTVFGYPMSYLELFGTFFNLWCVWLTVRRSVWNWPVGLVGVILFGFLFWQIQLYADVLEQVYYFATGVWGWFLWKGFREGKRKENIRVEIMKTTDRIFWMAFIIAASGVLGLVLTRVHVWFSVLFPESASFPFWDAITTVASFAAQILLVKRRIENWALWIAVDVIAVGLYLAKGVLFVSALYGVFLVLAAKGCVDWIRVYRKQEKSADSVLR